MLPFTSSHCIGAALPRPRGWWSLITVSLCYSFHHFHTAIHHLFTWQLLSITLSFLQGAGMSNFMQHLLPCIPQRYIDPISSSPLTERGHLQGQMIAGYWQAALWGSNAADMIPWPFQYVRAVSKIRKDIWASVQGPLIRSGIRMLICIRVGRSADCVFVYK